MAYLALGISVLWPSCLGENYQSGAQCELNVNFVSIQDALRDLWSIVYLPVVTRFN